MSYPIKSIRDLYFRFIEGSCADAILNAQHAADALQRAGLIEYIPHRTKPAIEHYRDLGAMRDLLDQPDAQERIEEIFRQYATDRGLGDV